MLLSWYEPKVTQNWTDLVKKICTIFVFYARMVDAQKVILKNVQINPRFGQTSLCLSCESLLGCKLPHTHTNRHLGNRFEGSVREQDTLSFVDVRL